MLNLLSTIKWAAALISLCLLSLAIYAWIPPVSWVGAIFASFLCTIFGAFAYVGFRASSAIDGATQVAFDVVGKHAEKISDAVVERVKKV